MIPDDLAVFDFAHSTIRRTLLRFPEQEDVTLAVTVMSCDCDASF